MTTLTEVYFNKIGKIEKHGMVYRYIFASVDPHFYFSAHVIPHEKTYDIYAIPQTNNLSNANSVKLGDNNNVHAEGIIYGEPLPLIIRNNDVVGMATLIDISIVIEERPIAVNGDAKKEEIGKYIEEGIAPLLTIGLFELANIVKTEVIANIHSIQNHCIVDERKATESFIFGILSYSSVFKRYLPEQYAHRSEAYTLFSKILYGGACTDRVGIMFADMISFFRIISERNISLSSIPPNILAAITPLWIKNKSPQYIEELAQASLGAEISMTVSLNPISISSQTKLFQVLNEIQSFVYINRVAVVVDGKVAAEYSFNPTYANQLYRNVDMCRVEKGVRIGENAVFTITYGYGQDCDNFIGMNIEDSIKMVHYGINKQDTIVNDSVEYAVVHKLNDKVVNMLNGELNSSYGMTFIIYGV